LTTVQTFHHPVSTVYCLLRRHPPSSTLFPYTTLFRSMGDQHIDVAVRRAESKFSVGLNVEAPKVPYRESITRKAEAMHRHKKQTDRKSTRLNSSHVKISYAVFCLKKKKKKSGSV